MASFKSLNVEKLADEGDVEGLIEALSTPRVRAEAAAALGRIGAADAVEPLVAALDDPDRSMRVVAAQALGALGDISTVRPLIKAARDRDPSVREAAITTLVGFTRLDSARAVESLISGLNGLSPDFDPAMEALVRIGAPAVEPLLTTLAALEGKNIYANDYEQRRVILETLGQIGDVQAVEPLISSLDDEQRTVRNAAAAALARLADERAIVPLVEANSVEAAGAALATFGEAAVAPILDALANGSAWDFRARDALVAIGALAVAPLLAALRNENAEVRKVAAQVLGQLEDPSGVEPLVEALDDREPSVRLAAAHALGLLRDARATGALIGVLDDEDDDVRQHAVKALGELGDARGVAPLIASLHDAAPAKAALRAIGQPAVEQLIGMLQDPNSTAREDAITTLGQIGDPRAIAPIVECLSDDDAYVRGTAAAALSTLGDTRALDPKRVAVRDKLERVLPWLEDPGDDDRVRLLPQLERIMEESVDEIDADLLRRISVLPSGTYYYTQEEDAPDVLGNLDLGPVNDRARWELIRRGLVEPTGAERPPTEAPEELPPTAQPAPIGTPVEQDHPRPVPSGPTAETPATSQPAFVAMSPDGRYWWDGSHWIDANQAAPPWATRSPDGAWWWDTVRWRAVPTR